MRRKIQLTAGLFAALLGVAACSQQGTSTVASPSAGPPQRGGAITVLEDTAFGGSWPTGLEPATNSTGGANIAMNGAIYGGLFLLTAEEDGSNAEVVPHQAESYEVSDEGRTLRIKIREGITFSDGTPFNAEAVRDHIQRANDSNCPCRPIWQLAEKDPITVEDGDTVVLRFAVPSPWVVHTFPISNVNWIPSPTALEKMGENKFKQTPVGAGPFKVVSNKTSSELVLERNPSYFKEGLPYLDRLTFKSIGGDQPAYQALQAGQAHAYEGMNTVSLIDQISQAGEMSVTIQPPTSPYVVQLNTEIAPFDNETARQAIYHATDFDAIARGLFKGKYPVSQSFTGAGGLYHHQNVPGYRGPDLERAKQLVEEAGGIDITLGTLDTPVANQVMTALQTQWREAGIKVEIESYQLNALVQKFGGKWEAMLQTAGAWDPAAGVGVGFRFLSTAPYSGVKDERLDELLLEAQGELDPEKRDQLYQQAGKYISDNSYAPFGLAFAPANVAVEGVHGPGLTTKIPPLAVNPGVLWDQVWTAQGQD